MAPIDLIQRFNTLLALGEQAFASGQHEKYETATRLAAKILRDLADADELDEALALEPEWYNRLVKKVESDLHYHKCFSWHKNAFWAAGQRNYFKFATSERSGTRIAFIAHTGVLLGHTEVMLRVIEDWREGGCKSSEVYFISLSGLHPSLHQRLRSSGIPFAVAPKGLGAVERVEWLARMLKDAGVMTAVWLSTPCWVSYVFGRQIAPNQVLWSLKFHAVHLGPTVNHIAQRDSPEWSFEIHGDHWISFIPPYCVSRLAQVAADVVAFERSKYPSDMVLLGSIAREEVLNSSDFSTCVVRILKENPRTFFLFTGKKIPELLTNTLSSNNLSNRSAYIGWVDVDLYCAVLDMYLDPFPFGSGVVCAKMIMSGVNVFSLWTETTLPRTFGPKMWPYHDILPNWHVTETSDQYALQATALIKNNNFSRHTGSAQALRMLEGGRSLRLGAILQKTVVEAQQKMLLKEKQIGG